jgi:hypothetical protein
MSKIDNGGPAFPRAGNEWDAAAWVEAPATNGATMRDYFAAAALTGSLAQGFRGRMCEEIATKCYDMADAMLRAREAV